MIHFHDFARRALVRPSSLPVAISATGGLTPCDLQLTDGPVHAILVGGAVAGTNPTLAVKLQESDTLNDVDFTDIAGAAFNVINAAGSGVQVVTFQRQKQHVRAHATIGGTGGPSVTVAILIFGQRKILGDSPGNQL
jgi:hypothetical protein